MKKPRLFISHAWKYNDEYYRLINLLNQRPYFDYYNHSVPEHDPLDFREIGELEELLENQMRGCQVVLVIAGMYATYREWIRKEIETAIAWDKPIIGIKPRGQERIPNIISHNAEIVPWNTEKIIEAIRQYI